MWELKGYWQTRDLVSHCQFHDIMREEREGETKTHLQLLQKVKEFV